MNADPSLVQVLNRTEVRAVEHSEALKLVCTACDEELCDVEHGDTLLTLAGMAQDHRCTK